MKTQITFDPKAYDAIDRASKRKSKGGTRWRNGVKNTPEDPHRAEREGLLGEIAFKLLAGKTITQEDLTESYELFDWVYNNEKIQIKTSDPKYPTILIRVIEAEQTLASRYVFMSLILDDRENKTAIVKIAGTCTIADVRNSPVKHSPAKNSDWYNHEVSRAILEKI